MKNLETANTHQIKGQPELGRLRSILRTSKAINQSSGSMAKKNSSRYPTSTAPINSRQSGAVLIVSLIMLLLLTLIGLTSSQVTSMEEKMAGNNRNHNLAFQAAESALRAAEAATATIVSANYYTGNTQSIDWANNKVTTYSSGTLAGIPSSYAPKYIVESLPSTAGGSSVSGSSLEAGTPGGSTGVSWYRITAKGMGGTANAVVMLQSIYKR